MDAIFMNSQNSKPSKPHVLILKFTDKLDLGRVKKLLPYQILVLRLVSLSNISILHMEKHKKFIQ